jgi:hypothetical protein
MNAGIKFSTDWQERNFPFFTELLAVRLNDISGGARILEVGAFEGGTTCWFLRTFESAFVHVIDSFEGVEESPIKGRELRERFFLNCQYTLDDPWMRRMRVWGMKSTSGLVKLQEQFGSYEEMKFDFIYIDADHSALSCFMDSALAWPLLKHGGIMIWDDFNWDSVRSAIVIWEQWNGAEKLKRLQSPEWLYVVEKL